MGYLRNDWDMRVEAAEFRRPLTHEEEEFRRLNTPGPKSKPREQNTAPKYNTRRHTCR